MTRRLACWIALFLLCASPSWAQVWPNEPAGASTVLDCPFSGPPSSCGIQDVYGSSQVGSDGSGLVSPPSALISTLNAGQFTGGMQLEWVTPGGSLRREMFVGMSLRTNATFQGRTVGNKMFFMKGPDSNGVFLFNNESLSNGTGRVIFAHNTGIVGGIQLDNSHVCADPYGATCYPNVGPGTMTVGTPTKIQAYIKCSTTNTSRDGIVRWWVNGAPAGNYTNLNYCAAGLNIWAWTETWDGSRCCTFATQIWQWLVDHLHISLPNCGASGCGGGVTPPSPPPPPPLPPNKPTNLRVQ